MMFDPKIKRKNRKIKNRLEDDVEFYLRLEFADDNGNEVEEYILKNAIERSIATMYGEIGSQSIQVEIVSYRYGTALIRTKLKMMNRLRCALTLYGIHENRLCAFRIEKKTSAASNEQNIESSSTTSSLDIETDQSIYDPNAANFSSDPKTTCKLNQFDELLQKQWNRAKDQGLFAFHVDALEQRTLDGHLNYIIELNTNRFEKRRTPYPFDHVQTPFNENHFNYNKINDDEILFRLIYEVDKNNSEHLVIINNSPIRPYHVLLVPNRQSNQPQILTTDCLKFGMRFVSQSANPFIYAGFNSVCGYASINHAHLHGIYLPSNVFVQTVQCKPFFNRCWIMDLFDAHAFVFEVLHINEFDQIANLVCAITDYCVKNDIAHNLALLKGVSLSDKKLFALRIFIWYRKKIIGNLNLIIF
ncbi:unnamed protein product [Didymodactylos carnosus]|uniref:GDPGP1-like N-terminal domain-containing protein n=1 Tax=Didymodactylos carnosus TaxID=1234261 RepID=A0A814GGE5_9BILA|nr:unnamed protein product [Didymodactylos carnosus]CAF3767599.1 unnamed protein product [Didymodactylos carnosus]